MTYYGAKELSESFRTVRKNTIITAEDIPEDQYNFQATTDTDSVASGWLTSRLPSTSSTRSTPLRPGPQCGGL